MKKSKKKPQNPRALDQISWIYAWPTQLLSELLFQFVIYSGHLFQMTFNYNLSISNLLSNYLVVSEKEALWH